MLLKKIQKVLMMISFVMFFTIFGFLAFAAYDSTPEVIIYEGRLLDPSAQAITSEHVFRFSLWSSEDYLATDAGVGGTINVFSPNYGGWTEIQNIIPNSDGTFSIELGTNTPLPVFLFDTHKYLQVEVKQIGEADDLYQLMDITGDDGVDARDRQRIGSVPYTKNAETLDDHEIGTTQGDIALIGVNDRFDVSLIPGGTNEDSFTIDSDNTQIAGTIDLNFGDLSGKTLSYDLDNSYFNFNDDVNIDGDLFVSGTINGQTFGPHDESVSIEPEYAGSTLYADGSDNRGKLEAFFVDTDGEPGPNNVNYYKWSTRQNTMQDIELVVRFKLPETFISWQAVPISFDYRTETGNLIDNYIEVFLEDTDGTNVVLIGASPLNSNVWASTNISFGAVYNWDPGEEITIKVKMYTTDLGASYPGRIELNYVSS